MFWFYIITANKKTFPFQIEEVKIVKGKFVHHPGAEVVAPEVIDLAHHLEVKQAATQANALNFIKHSDEDY